MTSRLRGYAELDRRVWLLAAVRAVNTMGLSLVMTFMAIYLVTERGLSAQLYGAIYLVANLGQSLSQGYAGELSDRLGRRPLMAAALVIRSLVIAGLGSLVLIEAPIGVIAATLVVSASLRGGFEPVAYAVVADVAGPEQRVAAFGLQRMGTNLGWAIGPALGGLLAVFLPYGLVFFCAAPMLLVSAIAVARMNEPARAARKQARVSMREALGEAFGRADVTALLACAFLFAIAHVQLFSTMSVYGAAQLSLSNADVGLIYMINGLAVLVCQLPAVSVIGRIGNARAMIAGALLYVLAFAGIGSANGFWPLAAAVFLLTLGEVVVAPAVHAAAANSGDPQRLGRAFGLLGTAQMLGVAVAPLIGGIAFDHLRDRGLVMWGVLAIFPALLALGAVWFRAVRRRERA